MQEQMEQESGGRVELRTAALDALDSQEPDIIIQGLAFLLVAGSPEDLPRVAPFTTSSDERTQKAARTCHFELSQHLKTD